MRRWVIGLVLLAGLGGVPVLAQDAAPEAGAPAASSEGEAQAPIPIADIPDRADADERYAATVAMLAAGHDPTPELAARLSAIAESVRSKTVLFRDAGLGAVPVLRLESLERYWQFDARRFARWRVDLGAATDPYSDAAAELARRRADWEATRNALGDGAVTEAIADRTRSVIERLQDAERRLSEPLQRQLALGRRGNSVEAEIEAGLRAIDAAIERVDARLLSTDSVPLWRVRPQSGMDEETMQATRLGLSVEQSFLSQYGASSAGNQRALLVFEVLLLPLLLWLSFRSRRRAARPAGPFGAAAEDVLRRPLSSWLLLSMLALLVLEPDAPLLLHQLAMLAALVPVLRLLPEHGRRLLGPWPYAASALYLLHRLAFFLLPSPYLYRWYFLGLTLLALATTGWLLWRSRAMRSGMLGGHATQVAHAAGWVAVVVLAVSLLANLAGNVTLSEMLTGALIDSGYMAMVLYAGINVALALAWLASPGEAASRSARARLRPALRVVSRILVGAAVLGWAVYAANRFRVYRPVYATLRDVLTRELELGQISLSLGDVLVFVLGVLVAFWAAGLVRFLLRGQVLPRMSLPRGVDNSIASISYYALLMLGLAGALAAAGLELGQLAFLFGALGVGIGFGLQNIVNNFVSGLILMFERPIKPGDVVEVTGTTGRVREIGMRATTITTFEGADVVVPNGTVLDEKVTNWTLRDSTRRMDVAVGVAYGADPDAVAALLRDAAAETPGVSSDPEPLVVFEGFGASSLDFAVRAWTHDADGWVGIRTAMASRIYAALVAAEIPIPFPQQDLHLRSVSEAAARLLGGASPGNGDGTRKEPADRDPD